MEKLNDYKETKTMSVADIVSALKAGGVSHLNLLRQFEDEKFDDKQMAEILDAVPPRTLLTLNLSLNNFGNMGCKSLARIIKYSPLKQLDLSETDFEEAGANVLASAIEANPTLEELNLQDTKLGNAAVNKIIVALSKKLKFCNVGGEDNNISTEGLESIIKMVKHNIINSLIVDWTRDTNINCVQRFFHALRDNTSIQTLECRHSYAPVNLIEETFDKNRTIVCGNGGMHMPDVTRLIKVNKMAKESNATEDEIRSVPQGLEGKKEMKSFVEELRKSSEPWNAMKLVLLGHGEVGKSTLLKTIQKESQAHREPKSWFQWTKEYFYPSRTIGVEQETMKIGNGEVTVWDFGGQLEYTVTHQFFLSTELVVYIICYDLSATIDKQNEQIEYWMDFLVSSLPQTKNIGATSKWRIIPVGLKKDIVDPSTIQRNIGRLKVQWERLPIFDQQFFVSSHKHENVKELLRAIEDECNRIFQQYTTKVPSSYKALLQAIKLIPEGKSIFTTADLFQQHPCGMGKEQFSVALQYLHSIGHIVLLSNGLACTVPKVIPKLAAKFISPVEVRNQLKDAVEILNTKQVGLVLEIGLSQNKLLEELQLLETCGVCFKLIENANTLPSYLFPSLAAKSDNIQFTIEPKPRFHYAGVRYTAPENIIFVPGFFCKLIVNLLAKLGASKINLVRVFSNGVIVNCPAGIFDGELMVKIEPNAKSIELLMMACNPEVEIAASVVQQLICTSFKQYTNYTEQTLCPECIEGHCFGKRNRKEIGSLVANVQYAFPCNHEIKNYYGRPPKHTAAMALRCCSHDNESHDFFYDNLSVKKKSNGASVSSFWDKKCLKFGQYWQDGFIHGLTSSRVILLLVSEKVLDGIAKNAPSNQDNVLVEYPIDKIIANNYN